MNDFRKRLANLLQIKSILTLSLDGVFCYLAIKGVVDGNMFMSIFTMVVGFYFGVQTMKEK